MFKFLEISDKDLTTIIEEISQGKPYPEIWIPGIRTPATQMVTLEKVFDAYTSTSKYTTLLSPLSSAQQGFSHTSTQPTTSWNWPPMEEARSWYPQAASSLTEFTGFNSLATLNNCHLNANHHAPSWDWNVTENTGGFDNTTQAQAAMTSFTPCQYYSTDAANQLAAFRNHTSIRYSNAMENLTQQAAGLTVAGATLGPGRQEML